MDKKVNILLIAITGMALAIVISIGIAGCGQDAGPDSISSHGDLGGGTGEFPTDCVICHIESDTIGPNPLITNGSGSAGKHIVHYSKWGFDCEKCHLGYFGAASHLNGVIDTGDPSVDLVFFDAMNPSGQWVNDTGPGTGSCTSTNCHGPDTVEWYGTGGWTLPSCIACHSAVRGSRRVITGTQGDFGANPSVLSHHVARGEDPTDAECTLCHDLSRHMLGEVRLIEADTSAVIPYDPADPAGLEPFCLSCHDSDGAGGDTSPFADGQTLGVEPYRMSAEIKTHWNKAYGHQQQGLTCLGDGGPDTGCHANGHGSDYAGILARNLSLPNDNGGPYTAADEVHYELCFNCHANYPRVTKEVILGVQQGSNYDWDHYWNVNPPYYIPNIMTTFRDRNGQGSGNIYDDPDYMGQYFNLHYWHLEDYIWNYRGLYFSGVSCITCHNMHGASAPWGWLYDEMQVNHYNGVGSDAYGVMEYADFNTFSFYPFNCTFNCHSILQRTYYWYQPPNE